MSRIWLDTVVLESLEIKDLQRLMLTDGHILVIANTCIDVRIFQRHIDWFENCLREGKIVIEVWNTPDEMVKKQFYWSSCHQMTQPAPTLAEAVKELPNAQPILELAKFVEWYGIPKGEWTQGQWAPPEPLTAEAAEILGIPVETANRSDVLESAKKVHRKDLFDAYNAGYCRGLAKQHCCDAMLASDGGLIVF